MRTSLLLVTAILAFLPSLLSAQAPGKVKVFVLAGQSNMEGKGFPEPLAWQVTQERYRERYRRFVRNGDFEAFSQKLAASLEEDPRRPFYDWSERDDVWINFLSRHGNLKVGYATPSKCFGPEYNFGHVVGDHFQEQVLLIKTAWGGKSLGRDFLSPSSKMPSDADFERMAKEQNERIRQNDERNRKRHEEQVRKTGRPRPFKPRLPTSAAEIKGRYGHYYRLMLKEVRDTTANLKERFPAYRGQGHEIAGFVWFQGWNDQFNEEWATRYGTHLANLIRDVRKDLGAPGMPFVVGQVGFDGGRAPKQDREGKDTTRTRIMNGQRAVASIPEFEGNVAVVRTAPFWDLDADAIYRGPGGWSKDVDRWRQFGNDRPYHYLGSPWFFAQAGTAFGRAMVGLLTRPR